MEKCRKNVDGGGLCLSSSVSALGTLRHVIDLHAQAPIFFLPLSPVFTLCIPVKRGPTALSYSLIRLATAPQAQAREKEDKCVLIERHAEGLGGLPVWVFGSIKA